MEKLYGYKEKDVLGLYEYLKNKKGTLVNVFKSYAKDTGKSVGTVRNLYYALVKVSKEDSNFCDKYLGGVPLVTGEMVFFDEDEEKMLVKKILRLKNEGYSVRSAINEISNGDPKLALRYQNKYRGLIKNKKEKVREIIDELKRENPNFSVDLTFNVKKPKENFNEFYLTKIKKEINSLYDRLFSSIKLENEELKNKIKILELENLRLKSKNLENTYCPKIKDFSGFNAKNPTFTAK